MGLWRQALMRSRSPGWSAPCGGRSIGRQIHSAGTQAGRYLGQTAPRPPRSGSSQSMLARLPGTARSCRTAQPCRSSGAKRRAVRRSPAAPRRQATASGLGRNRSPQPASPTASAATISPSRGASWRPRAPPTDTDPEEDGDPPGQSPGPGGPLGSPQPPPGRLGGAARPAHAGPHPAAPPPADRFRCRPAAPRGRR
jgi:hypothetical protein